jgi:GNAT superfamily N-acetyltransferase
MEMLISIRAALKDDTQTVLEVLQEAALWLEARGETMWKADEISLDSIAPDVKKGMSFVAECENEVAGVVKFQLEDPLFWPDVPPGEAAYVHRLAVRRKFAGGVVSTALLQWAVERTRELGRPFLRLDCEAARPKVRAVYERFGFRHHSDLQVGPYFVARYEYDCGVSASSQTMADNNNQEANGKQEHENDHRHDNI